MGKPIPIDSFAIVEQYCKNSSGKAFDTSKCKTWKTNVEWVSPKELLTNIFDDAGFNVELSNESRGEVTLTISPKKLTDYETLELLKAVRDKIND